MMSHTKPVNGFPGYEIQADGTVFSLTSNWRGYGRPLVLEHFGPLRPTPYHEVRHLNGNRTDNRITNLVWGTQQDNANDRAAHGRTSSGERHSLAIKNGLKKSPNARLIAAAPALLAACKEALNVLDEGDGGAMETCRAALAHAEGRG